jgi:hypothetical protein
MALKRRGVVQRIRVVHDMRRRIRMRRSCLFSPEVSVDLELKYERCFGICVACGFFLHGLEGCDKVLLQLEGLNSNSGSLQVASKGRSVESIRLAPRRLLGRRWLWEQLF